MIDASGQNLVFLVGLPRSGSTLLAAMLDNHPQVLCPPEPWMMLALQALGQVPASHPADSRAIGEAIREFLPDQTHLVRRFAVEAYNRKLSDAGRSVFVDKTPRYYLILPYLAELFPKAKFVWICRNPLAVALSYRDTWGIDIAQLMNRDPLLAPRPDDSRSAGAIRLPIEWEIPVGIERLTRFAVSHSSRMHTVRYEQLVSEPEQHLGRLLEFLELPWSEGLTQLALQDKAIARSYAGDKKIIDTSGPHQKSVKAWETKLSTEEVQSLLNGIGPATLRRLGYEEVVERCLALGAADQGDERAATVLRQSEAMLTQAVRETLAVTLRTTQGDEMDRLMSAGLLAADHAEHWSAEFNRLQSEVAALRDAAAQSKAAAAESEAAAARSDEAAAASAAETRAAYAELEAFRQAASSREADLESRITAAQAEVSQAKAEVAEAREMAEETQKLLEEARAAAADSAQTAASYAEHLNALRAHVSAITHDRNHLESRLKYVSDMPLPRRMLWAATSGIADLLRGVRNWRRARIQRKHNEKAYGLQEWPMPPLPSITIVTPVYNGAAHIRECIESVLSQGYPNLQYIVVDGGSTDGTLDIVNEYRDRISHIISEPDRGMYDAIAKGFELATGDILGYLNADDLYEAGGLLRVGEYFRDHPRTKVIYHEDTVMVGPWRFANNPLRRVDFLSLLKGYIIFQDGVFFRREAYWFVGGVERTLRLAGDWDLWTKMARYFRFRRVPGHVSSFRITAGQLSSNREAYEQEMEARRPFHRNTVRRGRILTQYPRHLKNRALNLLDRLRRRQFYYPLDISRASEAGGPPPVCAPPAVDGAPRCPLTGRFADTFLFSSPDTRLGDRMINRVYYCTESDLAVTHPPLTKEQLNDLYERYYTTPPKELKLPDPGYSPLFAGYFGGSRFDRLVLKLPLPSFVTARVDWRNRTFEELLQNLRGLFPLKGSGREISFLDVGCFEGELLDAVKAHTDWKASGAEPNALAVERARASGHDVWNAYAEDVVHAAPPDRFFDIIFLGQVIEHLLDPLAVVRRLTHLLKPGGVLVISTPNLHSKQIQLFGPTWAHWHVPYHRTIFSSRSLRLLASLAGMKVVRTTHYANPYWSALSMMQNRLGLGAVVSHELNPDPDTVAQATRMTALSKLLWNRQGRGDYLFCVMRKI
jgi:glycosyltransferase involved in cell wall biosynthesis/2-polyprenyl-3-methyl-5-hydroxy-6-metoxy-1,4-benzoquinol methylase